MDEHGTAGNRSTIDCPPSRDHSSTRADATEADAALKAMYAEHGRALLAYTQRITHDRGRAEDVVQETFFRAWRHLPGLLEDERPVRPWLFLVARRLIVDSARAASARPALAFDELTLEGAVDGGFDQMLDHTILLEAMQRLSTPHQQILVETFFAGHPVNVAAARLGVPPGTARSRLHYALGQLRRHLDIRVTA